MTKPPTTDQRPAATIKAVRGTRDILPPDVALWQQVEDCARRIFHLYNFSEIRTPVFEATELFARGVGEETDIVGKEMFTWEDKARAQSEKPQSLTLRPENTAGVVRAYIEHKLGETGTLQKLYYIGPQFRRERPQKGRYRQFWQIGAEALGPSSAGSESPLRDAEVMIMLADLLEALRITGYELHLNSIGSADDRKRYNAALRQALAGVKDKMCVDCRRRAETNPLRVLDCKVPEDQPVIETLPKVSGFLDDTSRAHFAEVQRILTANGISFIINERMVRGLDYYMRTVFEFTHNALGAQSALLGGGRYDGLSEALGGPHAPGVGFAIGLDRFVLVLQALRGEEQRDTSANIYVAPLGAGMNIEASKLAHELRKKNHRVGIGDENFRLKKSFEAAERAGASYIIIVGENEVKANEFAVKNLKSGVQQNVKHELLADFFKPTIERRNEQ
jgi:histidyl-tRNA synthetase